MILIGEGEEAAGNVTALKNIEHGQTCSDWQAVIEFVVDNLTCQMSVGVL